MDPVENDDVPTLSTTLDSHDFNRNRRNLHRSRTAVSISIPASSIEMNPGATNRVGFTGPLHSERKNHDAQRQDREPVERERTKSSNDQNEHLIKSGPLGMCNDPYCRTCPAAYKERMMSSQCDDASYRGAKMWAQEKLLLLKHFAFGVMNPFAKVVHQWNQFIVIFCFFAIFIDPLFFYLLSVKKDCKCIMINWPMTITIVVVRSMTDLIFLLHMFVKKGNILAKHVSAHEQRVDILTKSLGKIKFEEMRDELGVKNFLN